MSEEALLSKLSEILHVPAGALNDDTAVTPEQWDSIELLDVIAAIDESYGATVPADSLKRCTTLGELRKLIHTAVVQ